MSLSARRAPSSRGTRFRAADSCAARAAGAAQIIHSHVLGAAMGSILRDVGDWFAWGSDCPAQRRARATGQGMRRRGCLIWVTARPRRSKLCECARWARPCLQGKPMAWRRGLCAILRGRCRDIHPVLQRACGPSWRRCGPEHDARPAVSLHHLPVGSSTQRWAHRAPGHGRYRRGCTRDFTGIKAVGDAARTTRTAVAVHQRLDDGTSRTEAKHCHAVAMIASDGVDPAPDWRHGARRVWTLIL